MREVTQELVPGGSAVPSEVMRLKAQGFPAECTRLNPNAPDGVQGRRKVYFECGRGHEHKDKQEAIDCLYGRREPRPATDHT